MEILSSASPSNNTGAALWNDNATPADEPHASPDPLHSAEIAVLGMALHRNAHYAECVAAGLRAEHFTWLLHGELWDAIGEMIAEGGSGNPVRLAVRFADHVGLRGQSAARYIGGLVVSAAGVANPIDNAWLLIEEAQRRRLAALGSDLHYACAQPRSDVRLVLNEVQAELQDELQHCRHAPSSMMPLIEAVREAQATVARIVEQGTVDGVPFGLKALDGLLGGAVKSDLVVLAGRPGMGKTALAWQVALHNARAGKRVAFFTLEMPAVQLANRAISTVTQVGVNKMRRGTLDGAQQAAVAAADAELDLPLFLNRSSVADVEHVRRQVKELQRNGGIDLVAVDYLQLLYGDDPSDGRVQELAKISRGFKTMAVELDVPVIALSQLNRGVEAREDKRPLLSDLRDSGAIEQDADAVIFVYREEYYVAREEPRRPDGDAYRQWLQRMQRCAGQADLIVAKSRHGACGAVTVGFEAALMAFRDLMPATR